MSTSNCNGTVLAHTEIFEEDSTSKDSFLSSSSQSNGTVKIKGVTPAPPPPISNGYINHRSASDHVSPINKAKAAFINNGHVPRGKSASAAETKHQVPNGLTTTFTGSVIENHHEEVFVTPQKKCCQEISFQSTPNNYCIDIDHINLAQTTKNNANSPQNGASDLGLSPPTGTSILPNYRNTRPDCLSFIDLHLNEDTELGAIKDEPAKELLLPPMTIPALLIDTVNRYGNVPALHFIKKTEESDASPKESSSTPQQWENLSYAQYYRSIRRTARAFITLGLEKYHAVGIVGFNAPEWFISNFAAIFAGGLSVGIYTTNNPEACFSILQDCQANICVVEDGNQMKKMLGVVERLPHLKALVQYKENKNFPPDPNVLSHKGIKILKWSELDVLAEETPETCLEARVNSLQPNNCCTLIYTSGTTGNSKGVMISHDNLTWTARTLSECLRCRPHERMVSYLPLSHVAAQIVDIYMVICTGSSIYFAQPDALKGSLVPTLKHVRPTIFYGVPRVWEKIAEKIAASAKTTHGLKRHIVEWAKSVGRKSAEAAMKGQSLPWSHFLANKLLFSKIVSALGLDACRYLISTGAPAPLHTLRYFESLDMRIYEVYGASECTGPATVSYPFPGLNWIGSCGPVLPGTQIKIIPQKAASDGDKQLSAATATAVPTTNKPIITEDHMGGDVDHTVITKNGYMNGEISVTENEEPNDDQNEGEICIKGRHVFMGYLNMKEMTEEAIDEDGYFHTGDMGKLLKTVTGGPFLFVTGRIKELIITAGGENIAPIPIENAIKEELSEIISNVLVVGDYRKFISVLLTLKTEPCETTGLTTDKLIPSTHNFIKLLLENNENTVKTQSYGNGSIVNGYIKSMNNDPNKLPSSPPPNPGNSDLSSSTMTSPEVSPGCASGDNAAAENKSIETDLSSVNWLISHMPTTLKRYIDDGIDIANVKAVSRAAFVRKWIILSHDFTVAGGELGPTMKLRRPFILQKYGQVIESLYSNSDGQNDGSSVDTKRS